MVPVKFDKRIEHLLSKYGLPTDDLYNSPVELFAKFDGDSLLGTIGLERHGDSGLLRSLCVNEAMRGKGLAKELVQRLELHALDTGIDVVYLLTATAAGFFSTLNYLTIERASAPDKIAATKQFSCLCPSTATFMVKKLSFNKSSHSPH